MVINHKYRVNIQTNIENGTTRTKDFKVFTEAVAYAKTQTTHYNTVWIAVIDIDLCKTTNIEREIITPEKHFIDNEK